MWRGCNSLELTLLRTHIKFLIRESCPVCLPAHPVLPPLVLFISLYTPKEGCVQEDRGCKEGTGLEGLACQMSVSKRESLGMIIAITTGTGSLFRAKCIALKNTLVLSGREKVVTFIRQDTTSHSYPAGFSGFSGLE